MKPHLPVVLRKVVLACAAAVVSLTTTVGAAVFAGGAASFTLVGVAMAADATSESGNQTLNYSGGDFTWNKTTEAFSNGDETVAFNQGDSVIFNGTSTINFGEQLTARCVTIAGGADVTISGDGAGSLALETAEVYGTLKLSKGGENGSFSGDVDVYGTLDFAAGDVTGWSNSLGIKSIDVFEGGRVHVSVGVSGWGNNQTGAGLAINLMGGSITGVSNANLDLGYGGSTYGYSSISARAAADATAENPTVSTVSGTNLTLRQNATTISVAENARLDISSGILIASGKALLNSEGSVPAGITAGLVKTGAGELRLSGNNTYTQATTVAEGTLTLADSASLVSASVSLISGTTFKLDTSAVSGITCSGAVNGSGSIVKTGAGNATIGTIGSSFTGEIDVQMGTLSVQSFDFEQTKSVFIHSGATLDLNLAQGASYHLQTPIGGTGMLQKSGSGSLDISDLPDSFTGGISLQGGTLKVGDSLLVSNNFDFAVGTNDAVLLGSLTLGDGTLWLNASGSGAATSLQGSDLTLLGGTHLQLSGGNGGVYDLFSGITALRDKDGNIISLDSTNNAAANYFDINCPGSSFWADSTLQLTSEGTLQLVRHNEPVKNTLSVTSRLSSAADYRYYSSITFKDLDYSLQGGAVYVASSSTVTLSNNGSLSFSGNTAHHGGALMVYGNITVRENGSVSFIGNSATDGGAVWGYGNIVLSDNGSLSFRGNTATNGGALMCWSDTTLSGNGCVSFSGNSASYGGTVYVASSGVITLSNNGRVSFSSNSAFFGGALDVRGNITLSGNGHVSFDANSASYSGGAIYGDDHSNITLCDNGIISFCGNSVSESGGAIKALLSSTIMLSNNDSVSFVDNSASSSGGAISAESSSSLTLSNNKSVSFIGNSASDFFGGAIISDGIITMRENDSVIFIGNSASRGGAIYESVDITLSNNGRVSFVDNSASSGGGAICGGELSTVTLSNNASVSFDENSTSFQGGAFNGDSIILSNNGNVTFNGNSASSMGGAIVAVSVTLSDNDSVSFCANTSSSQDNVVCQGGAIGGAGNIALSGNESVSFCSNKVSSSSSVFGGAIYGDIITLTDNDHVEFNENTASGTRFAEGGAIYGDIITLTDNDHVEFIGNTVSGATDSYGGAICGDTITLTENNSVEFIGNTVSGATASYGGAIRGDTITLTDNNSVEFIGNTVSGATRVQGGAIYSYTNLSIQNNDSVTFYQNAEVTNGTYRLRSIYAYRDDANMISLSAAEGKNIEFRDSICICSGNTLVLNADYTDADKEVHEQKGDIIFTGKTTENDLYMVKGNVNGTAAEIKASRTSEVYTMTNLYGGRLRVEDRAIYKGYGITAHEDSAATVRVQNAELSHVGYDLTFNAGTALEVAGNSTIRGNVSLLADSLFKMEQAATLSLHETLQADAAELTVQGTALLAGSSTLNASLTLADGATLDMMSLDAGAVTINGALTFGGQVEMGENLMAILNEMRGWEESVTLFTGIESLVLPQMVASGDSGRVWVGNVFSNLAGNESYYIDFKADVGALLVVHVPEPTTTALSMLALSSLVVRRRRK